MIILLRKIIRTIKAILINTARWMFAPKNYPIPFIPFKGLSSYTMKGKIRVRYNYINGFIHSGNAHVYTKEQIDLYIEKIKNRETFYYGETDLWLYLALEKYGITNKEVAIIGSEVPLYESICIFFGGKPTTIEYHKIFSEDERLRLMTVAEYSQSPIKFDAAFSISSFEHDGLGRYGDPLNPDADLLAMMKMKSILKPNGILFLAVPIGMDTLVWNAHRIYGRLRLPLLLRDWELLEDFGFSDGLFNESGDKQPIFVLKNTFLT